MVVHRPRTEVFVEIIELILNNKKRGDETTKNQITRKVTFNYNQTVRHLNYLIEEGILRKVKKEDKTSYDVTDIGKHYYTVARQVL